jgi:hypothetical protein
MTMMLHGAQQQQHHDALVLPVATLDASTCSSMLLQMACMTRLRLMFQSTATEHLRCMLTVNSTYATGAVSNTTPAHKVAAAALSRTASSNNNNNQNKNANDTTDFLLLQSVVKNGLRNHGIIMSHNLLVRFWSSPPRAEEQTEDKRIASSFQHVLNLTCALHQQCQEMTISRVLSNRSAQVRDMMAVAATAGIE